MSNEKILSNYQLEILRKNSIISENEIAIQAGDLFYAKNILTESKRMLDSNQISNFANFAEVKTESVDRKILKG